MGQYWKVVNPDTICYARMDAPERHAPYRDRIDGRQVIVVAVYDPPPDAVDRYRVIEALQIEPLGSFFTMPDDEFHADFEEMI